MREIEIASDYTLKSNLDILLNYCGTVAHPELVIVYEEFLFHLGSLVSSPEYARWTRCNRCE